VQAHATKFGPAATQAQMAPYGGSKMTDIPEAQYGALIALLNGQIAQ